MGRVKDATTPTRQGGPGIVPPPATVTWRLWQLRPHTGRNKETGVAWKRETAWKLNAPPDANGVSSDRFPVELFSTQWIRQTYGDGRYRLEWLGRDGKRTLPHTLSLDLQDPSAAARAPTAETPVAAPPPHRAGLESLSTMELLAFLDARDSRAVEAAREQASRDQARDREFFAMMLKMQHAGPPAAPPVDVELLRREMRVALAEEMLEARKVREREERAGEPEEEPRPKTIGKATERLAMRALEQIEDAVPGAVDKIVPLIVERLKGGKLADAIPFTPAVKQEMQRRADDQGVPVTVFGGDGDPFAEAADAAVRALETQQH